MSRTAKKNDSDGLLKIFVIFMLVLNFCLCVYLVIAIHPSKEVERLKEEKFMKKVKVYIEEGFKVKLKKEVRNDLQLDIRTEIKSAIKGSMKLEVEEEIMKQVKTEIQKEIKGMIKKGFLQEGNAHLDEVKNIEINEETNKKRGANPTE